MPIIAGRTWEQLRVTIGRLMGAVYVSATSEAGPESDATSVIDNTLRGGDDAHNGKWIISIEGTNDGEVRRVDDYVDADTDLTVTPPFSVTVPNSMSYEMWDWAFNPADLRDLANAAILDTYGLAFDPEEDISLFADGRQARFDVPSVFAMLSRVERRAYVEKDTISSCDSDFTEATDAQMSTSVDLEHKKEGGASLKIATTLGNGSFVAQSITSVDLSDRTHIEGWFKAKETVAASDLVLRLDNATVQGDSSDLEVINLPATTGDETWTYFRVPLANPWDDTAIVSVGIEYNANSGVNTLWFDDIKAINVNSEVWQVIPDHTWRVDREAKDLVFTAAARDFVGYALLKLSGGDNPALFSSDASTTEVDDMYIIYKTAGLASLAADPGVGDNGTPSAEARRGAAWLRLAEQRMGNFPILENARPVT
jgi:hypothetical protein